MAFDIGKAGYGKPVSNLDKIQKIPLDNIQRNEKNFYDTSKVEDLMESIRMVGLLDPVRVVAMDDGKYRLLSGHRRFAAYERLHMEAIPEQTYARIPALILEGMDDLTETFALITANSTARELTYDEKLQQEQQLRETLMAMKEAGMEVPHNLGQYIADQIGVSRNEVSRMHSVNENLIPEAREKVAAGEMNANQAYELSRRPKEEQEASMAERLAAEYSEESALRKENLHAFVRAYADRLAYDATYNDLHKSERLASISLLGKLFRNSGGSNGEFSWKASGHGLEIGSRGYRNERLYTWTEIWDALAMYAIKKLRDTDRQKDIAAAPAVKAEWSNGRPTEDGAYAVLFRGTPHTVVTKRIMFWYNDCWNLFNLEGGCPIYEDAEVLGWVWLPDADDENEEEV